MSILYNYCPESKKGYNMSASVWTSEAIGEALGSVHLDGSSWLVDNWHRTYHDVVVTLVDCILHDYGWSRVTNNLEIVNELMEWVNATTDWRRIIEGNDVAMFPKVLFELKRFLLVNMDKEFCETVTRLSYQAVSEVNGELYHRSLQSCKAEYGVFRFRCVVGENLLKQLRRHLQVSESEFQDVYGECLLEDVDCCDELLIEMLVSGHLRGAVRSYKIEGEYYG